MQLGASLRDIVSLSVFVRNLNPKDFMAMAELCSGKMPSIYTIYGSIKYSKMNTPY
jgi:hypothetical protein